MRLRVAAANSELAHLSLRQVPVWSHQVGGEEGLARPQAGEEAVDTEQHSGEKHRHV